MTVADRIKLRREQLGLTQEQLAEKVGYTGKSSISKIETSGNDITLKKIARLAPVLQTSKEYLMGWVSSPDPNYVNTKTGESEEVRARLNEVSKFMGEFTQAENTQKVSTSGKVYYFDDEAAEMAQELFENEGERILMSASRGLKKEDMIALAEIAKRMRGTNIDG